MLVSVALVRLGCLLQRPLSSRTQAAVIRLGLQAVRQVQELHLLHLVVSLNGLVDDSDFFLDWGISLHIFV